MFFQIKEIILWPKDSSILKPRRLPFELSKVNVISGASKTGKSAIIPIIDYCLGSGKCSIPVNTIRNACEWFGVLVETSMGQKLFARREPGGQRASDHMYILEGNHIEVPDLIEGKNSSRGAIKRSLDELAGLTALDFGTEGLNSWFKARPSFRDLSAFLFQPQNLIANPNVLFYKADTFEHREKLETIFPYILNAITPQLLAKKHELDQLKKEYIRKKRELDTIKAVSERWLSEIKAKVSEASEFGLIKNPVSPAASLDQLIEILNKVVKSYNNDGNVTTETITMAINELVNLQREESNISLELSSLRRRFADMTSLRESAKQYQDTLQIQRDRLKISEWLWQIYEPKHDCPICSNSLESTTMGQLNLLYNSLKEIETQAGEFNKMPAAFDREFERVRSEIRLLTEKLQGVKLRRESLENSSTEARKLQYDTLNLSRFIGGLEQSLAMYSDLGKDSEISIEVEEIRIRINELEKEISEGHINKKIDRALDKVNLNAGRILPFLDCERPDDPVSLLIKDLTIKIKGLNREDYLWEVGSGANWLSYHISILLGLHEYFLSLTHSPVPGFIVFDQPSQVYFPRKLAMRESEVEEEYELKDVDLEAVKRIFLSFSTFIEKSKGNFQIIVLEHAGKDTWGGIERVKLVEEWGKDKKLVPNRWLSD